MCIQQWDECECMWGIYSIKVCIIIFCTKQYLATINDNSVQPASVLTTYQNMCPIMWQVNCYSSCRCVKNMPFTSTIQTLNKITTVNSLPHYSTNQLQRKVQPTVLLVLRDGCENSHGISLSPNAGPHTFTFIVVCIQQYMHLYNTCIHTACRVGIWFSESLCIIISNTFWW